MIFFVDVFQFLHGLMPQLQRIKSFGIISDMLFCCFFVFYRISRIKISRIFIESEQLKDKSLLAIDVSNPTWYILRSEPKGSLITYLPYHKPWFLCFYSLKVSHALHTCLFFKWDFISIVIIFIFNITVAIKTTHFCRFVKSSSSCSRKLLISLIILSLIALFPFFS